VRMQDQCDGRTGASAGMKTSFEASLGPWENDFWHEKWRCS